MCQTDQSVVRQRKTELDQCMENMRFTVTEPEFMEHQFPNFPPAPQTQYSGYLLSTNDDFEVTRSVAELIIALAYESATQEMVIEL
ncbi:hypothetical protein HGM15179_015289 [Zosterops borbonicus]|uniref:Uncharacterized protein n=1 Tax=Zosterops borbonicus TaxID=364589 RepID=A0A8K1G4Y0_9PASS|nr:hypothetical protein HGM15179_015289 [Zosterops borbonicus]